MKSSFNNIAVIGTGVIGSGWIIRFLFNKKKVYVYDPNKKQIDFLLSEIKRVKRILAKIYKKKINIKNQVVFCKTINEAVLNAELMQENMITDRTIIDVMAFADLSKSMSKAEKEHLNGVLWHLIREYDII